jgi:hypothetical protein
MRISVDERYAGYAAWLAHGGHGVRWGVTLDGAEVQLCLVADEELGEVLVYVRGESGSLLVEDGRVVTRWLRGVVVISQTEV